VSACILKDFELSEKEFKFLRELAGKHSGINLTEAKRELIYGRLARRVRALKLSGFAEYCTLLKEGKTDEFKHFINALTTNVTSFFREQHHFDYLDRTILPALAHQHRQTLRPRLRIWSAGCSTGEEPYSIGMTLRESVIDVDRWDARVLATDLDSNVLQTARAGIYPLERVTAEFPQRYRRWVTVKNREDNPILSVSPKIRSMITFRQLNLMDDWPMSGPFDVIFCRNVIIYFTKETQRTLINCFANFLTHGGYLIVGHSESLYKITDRFCLLGQTVHKKIA